MEVGQGRAERAPAAKPGPLKKEPPFEKGSSLEEALDCTAREVKLHGGCAQVARWPDSYAICPSVQVELRGGQIALQTRAVRRPVNYKKDALKVDFPTFLATLEVEAAI